MYRYFERHGKKILAVLGVFLMIVFIIPSGFRNQTLRPRGRSVGKLGGSAVYSNEIQEARDQWELLTHRLQNGRAFAFTRLGYFLAGVPSRFGMSNTSDGEIDRHPELFLLLSREAEREGFRISDDMLNTILTNNFPPISREEELREAVRKTLLIGLLHDELASSVKISQPIILHENAPNWQSVRLNLVEFTANEFKGNVPTPTTQQVQEQFETFKDILPNPTSRPANDPLGFGYEVPNRVQLQIVTIPRQAVMDGVRAGKSAYDWDVQARIYYQENQQEFVRPAPPVTQPASQPTTLPSAATGPATQPGATTAPASQPAVATSQPATAPAGPTTRPFAEVKQEILDKLLAPDADKLEDQITDTIQKRLAGDFQAWQSSNPTSQPSTSAATGPATQPAPFNSYAYLQSVAADIQKQYKVLPELHQFAEWQDSGELSLLPGIGSARTANGRLFADYATQDPAAFAPASQPSIGKLQLYEPSTVLSDFSGNKYIFRLTAASPAHSPDLKEIAARVEEDARLKVAYGLARDDARKLLDAAQKQGLSRAAVDAHKPVLSSGEFRINRPIIPNFIANPAATAALVGKTKALLEEATPDHPHPVALVEMPSEKKVVVVELADVTQGASQIELLVDKLQALEGDAARQVEQLSEKWFSFDAVSSRLDWKPDKNAAKG